MNPLRSFQSSYGNGETSEKIKKPTHNRFSFYLQADPT